MNPSLIRKPPARPIASRSGTAPVVLDQEERGGRVVRDLLDYIPGLLVGEGVNAFGARLGAGFGSGDRALFAFDPEADQRADGAAELDRLVLGEVAQVLHLDLSVRVLVDGQRVDDAHGVALAQPLELGDDLAVELGMAEAENYELNWSDCHVVSLQSTVPWARSPSLVERLDASSTPGETRRARGPEAGVLGHDGS